MKTLIMQTLAATALFLSGGIFAFGYFMAKGVNFDPNILKED